MNTFLSYEQLSSQLKGGLLTRSLFIIFSFFNVCFFNAYASSVDQFPPNLTKFEKSYQKVGEGKLVYKLAFFGWDVYQASLYRLKGKKDDSQVQIMRFYFYRDVEKKYLKQGWDEGMKNERDELSKSDWEWLYSITPDAKEGKVLEIAVEGKKLTVSYDGKVSTRESFLLSKNIFNSWIGPSPVDKELKNKLLGKN